MYPRKWLLASVLAELLFSAGCSPIYADGPYHGRVVDAETKQPIEGAAVLAVWWMRTPMIGHPMESVHDAQETMTDKDGNFTIPGMSTFAPISRIHEPRFTIFKPGYRAYPGGVLKPMIEHVPTGLYEKDGRIVAEIPRLITRDDRLRNLDRVYVPACLRKEEQSRLCLPMEKFANMIRLRNIERVDLGLKSTHAWKGEQK